MSVRNMHNLRKPSIYMLNDDCLIHIFEFLSITDKLSAENVCIRWNELIKITWCKVTKIDNSTWGCPACQIDTLMLARVLKRCGRFLKQFYVPNNIRLNTTVLLRISQYCPNLTHIDVSEINIHIAFLELFMKRCKHITNLTIKATENFSHNELMFLRECPELSHFEIRSNPFFTGYWLSHLPKTSLRTLVIKDCSISNHFILALELTTFKNLEYLELDIILNIHPFRDSIVTFILEVISYHYRNLKEIRIYRLYDPLVRSNFEKLEFINLVNLQVLKIINFPFSNKQLISIAKNCVHITYLDISGNFSRVDSAAIHTVTSLPKLEYLYVNGLTSSITDDSLENVKNLKELECYNCDLLTDNGICKILASSPQLRLLDITNCFRITNITYETAKVICDNRPNKEVLEIRAFGTQISLTDEEVATPFLRVVFDCLLSNYLKYY